MIEEQIRLLEESVDQIKRMISYFADREEVSKKYSHLLYCRDRDGNFEKCCCGATDLNRLRGVYY